MSIAPSVVRESTSSEISWLSVGTDYKTSKWYVIQDKLECKDLYDEDRRFLESERISPIMENKEAAKADAIARATLDLPLLDTNQKMHTYVKFDPNSFAHLSVGREADRGLAFLSYSYHVEYVPEPAECEYRRAPARGFTQLDAKQKAIDAAQANNDVCMLPSTELMSDGVDENGKRMVIARFLLSEQLLEMPGPKADEERFQAWLKKQNETS